jgi:hypothetical protein
MSAGICDVQESVTCEGDHDTKYFPAMGVVCEPCYGWLHKMND